MSSHDPQSFVCMFSIDETNKTLILPLLKTGNYDCKVDWGDGQSSSILWNPDKKTSLDCRHDYSQYGRYKVESSEIDDFPGFSFFLALNSF